MYEYDTWHRFFFFFLRSKVMNWFNICPHNLIRAKSEPTTTLTLFTRFWADFLHIISSRCMQIFFSVDIRFLHHPAVTTTRHNLIYDSITVLILLGGFTKICYIYISHVCNFNAQVIFAILLYHYPHVIPHSVLRTPPEFEHCGKDSP